MRSVSLSRGLARQAPGELQNVIERAVILSPSPSLQVPPGDLRPATPQAPDPVTTAVTLADAERQHILGALGESGWSWAVVLSEITQPSTPDCDCRQA